MYITDEESAALAEILEQLLSDEDNTMGFLDTTSSGALSLAEVTSIREQWARMHARLTLWWVPSHDGRYQVTVTPDQTERGEPVRWVHAEPVTPFGGEPFHRRFSGPDRERQAAEYAELARKRAGMAREPVDPGLYARTAPAWNCITAMDGPHLVVSAGSFVPRGTCLWCGGTP